MLTLFRLQECLSLCVYVCVYGHITQSKILRVSACFGNLLQKCAFSCALLGCFGYDVLWEK